MKSRFVRRCFAWVIVLFAGVVAPPVTTFAQLDPPDSRGQGYEPDPPEEPGTITHVPRFRAFLPVSKDLSALFPPPGDQGKQGSCVAWSAGYALRGYYYRRRTQSRASDAANLFSPSYIYNQLVRTPDCTGGSNIKAALDLMRTEGVATLADFPYDERSCQRKPDGEIRNRAATNAISGYRSFGRAGDIRADDVKGSLLAGDPVEIGLNIDQKELSHLRRGEIYDQDGPTRFNGHAMVVTGFDDRLQAFKVINSWGTRWADGGFGWISYRAFTANTLVAFVVKDSNNPLPPAPTPAPPPAPAPVSVVPKPIAPPPVVPKPISPPPIEPKPVVQPPVTPRPIAPPPIPPPPVPSPQVPPRPVVQPPFVPKPVPPPPMPPVVRPATDMASLTQTIAARTAGFACSRLALLPTGTTSATLNGWVAEPADLETLNALLRTMPSSPRVTSEVKLRPWPQCEALMTVTEGVKSDHGMAMATVDHPATEYETGSRLVMRVKTPDYPSYLYVTYLPASGDAVLLYKPRGMVPERLPPRTIVDLGGGADPRVFKVGPPFGAEMVIAVATASPLFTDGIPASATERDYLTALRKTLLYKPDPGQPDRIVDASVLALTTRDRAP